MAATDAPREESAAKQPKNAGGGVHVTGLVLVAALVGMYVVDTYFKPSLPRASTKPFKTFEEFLPFYLSEHSDVWCRRVHFIGTTIALTFFLRYPTTILNAIAAASVGMCLMPLTAHLDLGLIEGGAMILTFFLLSRYTTGSFRVPVSIAVCAYSFAWFGHFYFEQNRPATFIYPTFSLMGDWVMWSMTITGAIPR